MEKFLCKWGDLAYRIEGSGAENYIFVHNIGGNHQFLESTFNFFCDKGRCLSMDLRGHGQSHAPEINYTLETYAQDIFSLCQHCGMERIVFIGLNFGGNVGIALQKLDPQIISKLILIEPPILMEPWIINSVKEHIRDLKDEKSVDYAGQLVDSVLMHASSHHREIAIKAFETTPRYVQISTYENLLRWDQSFKNETTHHSIPTLLIQTSKPFCCEEKLGSYFSQLYCCRVIGSGPWTTLEVPEQTNSMIDRFLQLQS